MNYINASALAFQDAGTNDIYEMYRDTVTVDEARPALQLTIYKSQVKRIVADLLDHHKVQTMIQDGYTINQDLLESAFIHWLQGHVEDITESWSADDFLHSRSELLTEIKSHSDNIPSAA